MRLLPALLVTGLTLLGGVARAQSPSPAVGVAPMPSDEQSFRKEFIYGINFNTQGALIGGVSVRSARVLSDHWLRIWSLEATMFKNPKEQRATTNYGGTFIENKVNYAFALRPSIGIERVLFRKAPDSGVQVNALVSAGPSIGLLLPYYIVFDRSANGQGGAPSDEQYDPEIHEKDRTRIMDHASLFEGISGTRFVPGGHLRAALSFEYGRYREAVTGVEAGFLLEAYSSRLVILRTLNLSDDVVNRQFFPSVYLTLYFGQRS